MLKYTFNSEYPIFNVKTSSKERKLGQIKTIKNSPPLKFIFNLDDLLFLAEFWQDKATVLDSQLSEPFLKNPHTAKLSFMSIHRNRARNCQSLCCFLFCRRASNCALRKFCRLQTCFALIYFTAPLRFGLMSVLIPGF